MSEEQKKRPRPLSPHLQIYKPQLTSVLSIIHRGTGVFLCAGAVIVTLGLLALSDGMQSWESFREYASSLLGKLVLSSVLLALVYHFLNGIRHLAWDAGYGLDIKQTYASGKALLVGFVVISAALLYVVFRSAP